MPLKQSNTATTNFIFSAHDIQVAVDGNFHHRRKAPNGPEAPTHYTPTLFLSKEEMDCIGEKIEVARGKGKRSKASDSSCSNSFSAAQERRKMSGEGRFSDKGLMAMVCRHDIPLFLANIDSSGEQ